MRLAAAVVSRIVGSSPEPIRAHWASTTIRCPFRPAEPVEIDVIARDPTLDDQRRLGDRLGRLEGAVLLLLGDLRKLAHRKEERVRDPIIGLDPDRVDSDGGLRGDHQLEFPRRGVALRRRRFRAKAERGDQLGIAGETRSADGDLGGHTALDSRGTDVLDLGGAADATPLRSRQSTGARPIVLGIMSGLLRFDRGPARCSPSGGRHVPVGGLLFLLFRWDSTTVYRRRAGEVCQAGFRRLPYVTRLRQADGGHPG